MTAPDLSKIAPELARLACRIVEVAPNIGKVKTMDDVTIRIIADFAYALGVEFDFSMIRRNPSGDQS